MPVSATPALPLFMSVCTAVIDRRSTTLSVTGSAYTASLATCEMIFNFFPGSSSQKATCLHAVPT